MSESKSDDVKVGSIPPYHDRNAEDSLMFEDAVAQPYRPSPKPVPVDPARSAATSLDLENLFSLHPAKGSQMERYRRLHDAGLEFAKLLVEITPRSPEQTLAIRAAKSAVHAACDAIAVNE